MSQKIKVNNNHNGNPGLSGWYAILPEPEPPQVLTEDINAAPANAVQTSWSIARFN